MKHFYKFIPLLMLVLPLASTDAVAANQQQAQPAQGPTDSLTPQQREQHMQQMHQQQEKMQEAHDKMMREMNARRLEEELKK